MLTDFEEIESAVQDKPSPLEIDLHSTLVTWSTVRARQLWQQIGDVVPRMSIKTCSKTFLIQVVSDEANASAEYEKSVENTHLKIIFGLFRAKGATVAHEIDETDSHTAIDVEDQVVLFASSDRLYGNRIVEHLAAWETLLDEFFDKFYT